MFVPVALAGAHNRGTGIRARIRCRVHKLREIGHRLALPIPHDLKINPTA